MPSLKKSDLHKRVATVREFNRFYTQKIGVLHEGLLESQFSLTEVRILYELYHGQNLTASDLCRDLAIDPGYLSRILSAFQKQKLIAKTPSAQDARQHILSLTDKGRAAFEPLNARSEKEVAAMLKPLSLDEQNKLIQSINVVQQLLDSSRTKNTAAYVLREHQPGDMGWIIHRQAVLYNQEYNWDEKFEALIAEIAAKFMLNFDAQKEHCWIAEVNDAIVGSVFVVKESDEVAKLRLLYVEPHARGLGIGRRLVQECIKFARQRGYQKMTLWTNDILHSARRIYEQAGFQLVLEEQHYSFGQHLTGQNWELKLT